MSPETAARITVLRQKMLDNTATIEELREGIAIMREDRKSAASAAASSGARKSSAAKPKAKIEDPDDMLNELGGLK